MSNTYHIELYILMRTILPILLLCGVTSCEVIIGDRSCTEAGCSDTYTVTFNIEDDSLSLGRYEVEITREDQSTDACRFSITGTGDACSQALCINEVTCNPGVGVDYNWRDDEAILFFPKIEGVLDITVRQDSAVIASVNTTPVYGPFYPNGPGCSPVCSAAEDAIQVIR